MQAIHQEGIPVVTTSPTAAYFARPGAARSLFFQQRVVIFQGLVLACVAGLAGPVQSQSAITGGGRQYDANETVVRWNFARNDDRNFDHVPDGWNRTFGRRYPRYLKLEIVPHDRSADESLRYLDAEILNAWLFVRPYTQKIPARSLLVHSRPSLLQIAQMSLISMPTLPPSITDRYSNHFLRGEVDGGAIASTSPAFPVDLDYSYRLQARIKTEGLVHNRAWVEMEFLDENGEAVETLASPKFGGETAWTQLNIGPKSPPRRAQFAQLTVRFEPEGRGDLSGWVGYDDLLVTRFPRIRVETDQPLGLYAANTSPMVRCIVSGIEAEGRSIDFRVVDDLGNQILDALVPLVRVTASDSALSDQIPIELTPSSGANTDEEIGGVAEWQVPKLGPGFYRIRANLAGVEAVEFTVEQTIGMLSKLPKKSGPFGWSITGKDRRKVPLKELPDWLEQAGVQWLKYSCWIGSKDLASADDLAWLAGRLDDREIEMVGVLDNPPVEVRNQLNVAEDDPAAILFRDSAVWQPVLEPVMTRLTSGIQWWQLGNDRDYSFLGRPQLKQVIEEIHVGLQGFGQPIQLAINWPWLEPTPQRKDWSWDSVILSERTPLTGDEIDAYFEEVDQTPLAASEIDSADNDLGEADPAGSSLVESEPQADTFRITSFRPAAFAKEMATTESNSDPASQRPWIILQPLPKSQYSRADRIQDLIIRMLAVRRQKIPAAFVSQPFDPELAFLRQDGSPDEMLLPWRTASALLAGMYPVGSLELPNDSQNVLLADGETAVLVVWSDRLRDETLYLGAGARQIDAFGRDLPIQQVNLRGFDVQQFQVTPEPSFIVNMDRTAALWRLGVRLDRDRIDSLLGREQTVKLQYQNPAAQSLSGTIRVETPDSWGVSTIPRPIAAEPFREREEPISIILRADATIGRERMAIDFDLEGDRRRRFTVWRPLEVGPEDIKLDVSTRLLPDGRLLVRQEITNTAAVDMQFDCYVFAPGRRRQRRSTAVDAGQTIVQEFVWANGADLIGKDLLLSAEQLGGDRTLNYRFKATK